MKRHPSFKIQNTNPISNTVSFCDSAIVILSIIFLCAFYTKENVERIQANSIHFTFPSNNHWRFKQLILDHRGKELFLGLEPQICESKEANSSQRKQRSFLSRSFTMIHPLDSFSWCCSLYFSSSIIHYVFLIHSTSISLLVARYFFKRRRKIKRISAFEMLC